MAKKRKQKLTRQQRVAQRETAKRNRTTVVGVLAALVIGIIGYFGWTTFRTSVNALPAESVADPWLGAPPETEGSIEIVEFSDFGCPACRSWHNAGIRDQILDEFGDKVRFVWKDFPVITALSPQAAEAGHCAAAQGKFWEYHDHVYENHSGLGREELRGYAEASGIDVIAFDECIDNRVMVRKVQVNEQKAREVGMRGTPGFTLNGRSLGGPPNYERLVMLINQELAQSN